MKWFGWDRVERGETERDSRHIGIFPFNACVCLAIDIGNIWIVPYVYGVEVDATTPLTFWCMNAADAALLCSAVALAHPIHIT